MGLGFSPCFPVYLVLCAAIFMADMRFFRNRLHELKKSRLQ